MKRGLYRMERPLIAILDNKDQLLCVTDEYEGGNLHTYLLGTAAFFRCSILQKSAMAPFLKLETRSPLFIKTLPIILILRIWLKMRSMLPYKLTA